MSQLSSKPSDLKTEKSYPPRSPKAVLSVSREEFYGQDPEHQPLELIIKEGLSDNECKLPDDLQGHVFVVGAVGTVDSPPCQDSTEVIQPTKNGWTPLFNGDGMIYRLDFHKTLDLNFDPSRSNFECQIKEEAGKAWIATRIVKTPDYYADAALYSDPFYRETWPQEYPMLKFNNFGLTRVSLRMGSRNSLNTAFLPLKFSDKSERLLVTWDAGRPYEIDPRSLGFVGPIGWNREWYPITPLTPQGTFAPILSAAHPQFDTHSNEMFTVNCSKSLKSLLWISRLLTFDATEFADRYIKIPCLKALFKAFIQVLINILLSLEGLLQFLGIGGRDRVYLRRWMGSDTSIDRWEVLQANGKPLSIEQSLHQMGLTKNYVLLSDSAFKLPIEDLIPSIDPTNDLILEDIIKFLKVIREYLSYPELPYTYVYIIPREQLKPDVTQVKAHRVKIAPEMAHFLVDYDDSEGKITLHAAHTAASDPAEFIHATDESVYDDPQVNRELKERAGMITSVMDVDRLGCWVIDVKKETCESVLLSPAESCKYLWSLAVYTWQGFQPERFTDIYWNCWGAWQELLSQFILEMYKDYENRTVPVQEMVDEVLANSKPSNVIRLHIDRTENGKTPRLSVEDAYNFPPGYFGNSPQFVPRSGSDDPTNGYVVCVVIHSDNLLSDKSELWIFDAKDLSSGPRYRLSHPKLNMGVTVHSAWLSKLETPPARTDYSVRQDYEDLVEKTKSPAIATLFERDIYPHFE